MVADLTRWHLAPSPTANETMTLTTPSHIMSSLIESLRTSDLLPVEGGTLGGVLPSLSSGPVVLSSAASHARSGGGSFLDLDATFTLQMFLFLFLVVALKPLLFDPLLKVFEEREKRTDGARSEAREMQKKAGELLVRYEQAIARVSSEVAKERDAIRAETARLEERILNEARAETAVIVERGRRELAAQVEQMRFELGRQSERLGRDVAEKVLGRSLSN